MAIHARAYTSPTLVLLAYDWSKEIPENFLGFAIERTPGFHGEATSWLPNRIGFNGPPADGGDLPSDVAPIQKFYWWDARIDTRDRGTTFTYRIVPVVGTPEQLELVDVESVSIAVRVPNVEEKGIATHFNRAVVSSQSFARAFPALDTPSRRKAARAWLANGMEQAIPEFLARAGGKDIEGAIYHLTDEIWIVPSFRRYGGMISLAYNQTHGDHTSDAAIEQLVSAGRPESSFAPRTHANIMHDKFLVRVGTADHPEAVLTGSANFTSEGLSVQANLLHAFESPDLAKLYLARKRLLDGDPTLAATQHRQGGWSETITMEDATLRVFFPPEPGAERRSLDAIVHAVRNARSSVLLCAFDPTDAGLLDAVFGAYDRGLMMLALVNRVPAASYTGDPERADVAAKIAILDHHKRDGDVQGFDAFSASDTPTGFMPEHALWPGENPKIMVRVHHKFVVIDGDTEAPTLFTGSANFSGNALHHNDENLLEITGSPRLAQIYVAEFMRLYEHYRARLSFYERQQGNTEKFTLAGDSRWSKKYFQEGTPAERSRRVLGSGLAMDRGTVR